jgi:hypothetical protein
MISTALLYYAFLKAAFYMKKLLIYAKVDIVCKAYLKVSLQSVWTVPDGDSFGYCNAALILILNGFLISFFYDQIKGLVAVFL